MLQRLFPRQLFKNISKLSKSQLSAVAQIEQVAQQVEQDRTQPFMDTSSLHVRVEDIEYEQLTRERKLKDPPIIEPQFFHKGQFVMDPSKYTIDCNKFNKDEINSDNLLLRNEMISKFNDIGLVYLINTNFKELQDMRKLVSILIPAEMNMEYKGGSNWRNYIEPNIYDTGAPKEAWIHYHHEMAYIKTSPQSLAFCAKSALPNGRGATFVSDQVQATKELLTTPFGQKLKEKGICYIRCLTDEEHYKSAKQSEFDVYNHWQKSFGSTDPEQAGRIAQERGLKIEWNMNHPRYGRYLITRFYIDVYEYFPLIDKNLLYASVADHWMWFDQWPGVNALPNDERPLKITFGDDTELTRDELKQFVDIYDKYGIPIQWNVGDIAILCNFRWAHGRPIYTLDHQTNEERELGVVLGQVYDRQGQMEGKWF